MKKILALAAVVVLLSACSGKEKDSGSQRMMDFGTSSEYFDNSSYTDESDYISVGQGIEGEWMVINTPDNVTSGISFDPDGTFVMIGQKTGSQGQVTDFYSQEGTWTQSGDRIFVSSNGEKEVGVFTILSFNGRSLVIQSQDDEIFYLSR